MAPPFDTNPLTRMWCLVTTSQILVSNFLEYVKLVELPMVQVVGSVEDEPCFSTLAFMKSKLCNRLTTHLPLVVHMFAQHFYTIYNFPYEECISNGDLLDTVILMMAKVQ
jgi:hypothetical protein